MTLPVFVPRRLDKFLRDSTHHTVVEVRGLLAQAVVTVGGAVCTDAERLVFEDDAVMLNERLLSPRTEHEHFAFHKPRSVTSTTRDPRGKADLSRFMASLPRGVFPVGRLDRETTGLMLFTSDGDLANAVLHPDHGTTKSYWIWLDDHVPDDDERLRTMQAGVQVGSDWLRVEGVQVEHRSEDFTELSVTLHEGKNRHLRRLCRALDFHLVGLHRRRVGPIELGALAPGSFRPLHDDEVTALWRTTGGRKRVLQRKVRALHRLAKQQRAPAVQQERLERWLAAHEKSEDAASGTR
ncbi:MAG: pseudouridine synthase [Polyangiaceae bacterium]